jgi:ketosteroid isomerase-like protein
MTASANLNLVRSILAAWERGDFSSSHWVHPQIDYAIVGGLEPGTWRGAGEMAARWGDWLRAWDTLRAEAEEYRQLDDERVLVLLHVSGRGKTSAVEIAQTHVKGAVVFHVRDGKVTRLVQYWDRDRALADLGLAPEAEEA